MKSSKLIAMYLPQFHSIPENDLYWGKGFTDWVTVKNAKPLFNGHHEPKVPLNDNYYDLSKSENIIWQADIAKKYGIHGFGVYHYWFNNEKNLLTKPAEIIRDNESVDINYLLAWDNTSWVRSWSNLEGNSWAPLIEKGMKKAGEREVMIPYIIGERSDWEIHYKYLREHFISPKYIKKENKPIFIIYHISDLILKMCDCWNEMAKRDGYDGIYFIFRYSKFEIPLCYSVFKYEPQFSGFPYPSIYSRVKNKIYKILQIDRSLKILDYDKIWGDILNRAECDKDERIYHGGFVSYDDTPRRGMNGSVIIGASPDKFGKYVKQLKEISQNQNKEFIFLTAWNEWGEGAYMEPDTINKFRYLEAL